ncbi:MAG: SDR family NAD(P)-dependent oxidoreductase [Bacilli bacterium]|nr:SDR family NAD(P)-dependent oxidoreductase [Bacilli bacterium]
MNIAQYVDSLTLPSKGTALITGGNSGIGFEFTRHILRLGWSAILAIRNMERGEKAKEALLKEFPSADVRLMHLDLADKQTVHSFCDEFIATKTDVDVFYCNAGIYRVPYAEVYDHLESMVAVNFVSNLILYERLSPYLHTLPHRVKWILTSSITARPEHFHEADFYGGKKFNKAKAYGRSKVAVNHLYLHLIDECRGTNILPLLVHPGVSYTPLINKAYHGKKFQLAAQRFMRAAFHKPDKASLTTLRLLDESVTKPCFCGPRGLFHVSGYPTIYPLYKGNTRKYKETIRQAQEILRKSDGLQ